MMTSNRPLEDWGKLIGDVPAATAILDRFLHHAEIIQITGKSYRLRSPGRNQEEETGTKNGQTDSGSETSKQAGARRALRVQNRPPNRGRPWVQNRPLRRGAHREKAGKKLNCPWKTPKRAVQMVPMNIHTPA